MSTSLFRCPRCGSGEINGDRLSSGDGALQEFFCSQCHLRRTDAPDYADFYRRWSGRHAGPALTAVCSGGGYLVGSEYPVPEDPRVHYQTGGPWVGCNRLLCPRCDAFVRNIPGYRYDMGTAPITDPEAQIYEERDPARSPHLTPKRLGDRYRVYACRCTYDESGGLNRVSLRDVPWRCAGHPQG